MKNYKVIEAKVTLEMHELIRKYCFEKRISMKKFARIAVEYYCEQLKKDGEMNV